MVKAYLEISLKIESNDRAGAAGVYQQYKAPFPAGIKGAIYGSFIEKEKIKETLQGFNTVHPIGRVGTPEDIARTIVFLLSDESSWVTGAI